jgi:hypothetical protein
MDGLRPNKKHTNAVCFLEGSEKSAASHAPDLASAS